ncbi:MAG: hypothetical protein ACI83I_002362, partial [Bacteroidia bacterium]
CIRNPISFVESSRFITINLPVFASLLGLYPNLNFKRLIELRLSRQPTREIEWVVEF